MEMVQNIAQITRLQEENDNMKCQLEAYKNEIELTKKEQDNSGENKVNIFLMLSKLQIHKIDKYGIDIYFLSMFVG